MRPVDLIESFSAVLMDLAGPESGTHNDLIAAANTWLDREEDRDEDDESDYDHDENGSELVSDLFDALGEYAPPYGYFGAHPGDGADYGFWLSEDFASEVKDNGGLIVDDLSEVPADYTGEVLHINDHGNATLYAAAAGQCTEIWSVV